MIIKEKGKERDASLDIVGGLYILWMMFYHTLQFSNLKDTQLYDLLCYIFFPFMAWFFFKGGLFAKKTDFLACLRSGYKRLLIPFLIFSTIGTIVLWLEQILSGEIRWQLYIIYPIKSFLLTGSFPGNVPLWFLLSLFFVRMLFVLLVRWRYTDVLMIFLLISFYLLKYWDLFSIGSYIIYPFYIYNIFAGLLFYWLGYRFKGIHYNHVLFYVCFAFLVLLLVLCPSRYDLRSITLSVENKGDFMAFIISSFAACIVIDNVFQWLQCKIGMSLLRVIGRESLLFFCTHWIILILLRISIISYLHLDNNWQVLLVYCLGLIMLLPICRLFLKRLPIQL